MNANYENHDDSDELLRILGRALGRGSLAGLAEAQAAFDAAASERLSADELAWLLRLTRGGGLSTENRLSTEDSGYLPPAASLRPAKTNGQRLRTESLERRDATAPLWLVPGLTPLPNAAPAAWEGGCELASSGFESSDWGPCGIAVSTALVGGVLAVWFGSGQCRQAPAATTRDEARLYDRALVELADACLVA